MTTKSTAKAAAKPAPKAVAKKPRKLDLARLKRLADELTAWGPGDVTDLLHRWETEEGAKVRTTTEGRAYVKLANLEIGARGTVRDAVMNWGQAARRAVLKGA